MQECERVPCGPLQEIQKEHAVLNADSRHVKRSVDGLEEKLSRLADLVAEMGGKVISIDLASKELSAMWEKLDKLYEEHRKTHQTLLLFVQRVQALESLPEKLEESSAKLEERIGETEKLMENLKWVNSFKKAGVAVIISLVTAGIIGIWTQFFILISTLNSAKQQNRPAYQAQPEGGTHDHSKILQR
ncbi:MAG: hypothetical protein K8I29_19470 [Alphaproteobacteria bacterium]|uniref:Uncharacterized protein n=1 Tax=Candidatus Nitrobium versatile TaxID=2884831 RepID=A0A953SI21_9BACT|nr:hypothetical protein [Candidatus Nitrobium versatile]